MSYWKSAYCLIAATGLGLLGGTKLTSIRDANAPKSLPMAEKRLNDTGAARYVIDIDKTPQDGKVSVREVVYAILEAREYKPLTDDELDALERLSRRAGKIVPTQAQSLFTALQELKK